jgi:hypothetical protein
MLVLVEVLSGLVLQPLASCPKVRGPRVAPPTSPVKVADCGERTTTAGVWKKGCEKLASCGKTTTTC